MRKKMTSLIDEYTKITHGTSKVAEALAVINDYLYERRRFSERIWLAYRYLGELFQLEDDEISALALHVVRGLGRINPGVFARFIGTTAERCHTIWDGLVEKGFIHYTLDSPKGFKLTERCIDAFCNDVPLNHFLAKWQYTSFIKTATEALDNTLATQGDPVTEDRVFLNSIYETNGLSAETVLSQLDAVIKSDPNTDFGRRIIALSEGLSWEARLILFLMLGAFARQFIKPIHSLDFKGKQYRDLFPKAIVSLIEKGLVVQVVDRNRKKDETEKKLYRISPKCAEVFKGQEGISSLSHMSDFGRIIRPDEIESKELFFPESDRRNIRRLRRAVSKDDYQHIMEAFQQQGLRGCLAILMYGAPGTGKTELTRQIARETGRSIILADASKLNGVYIGESAISYRSFFQTYRYLYAVEKEAPILFLDEADGMLGKRVTDIRRAGDRDANSTQNIILDEMNSLPGIIIATTNLKENLDDALFRRFNLHLEFHLPDKNTRMKLWKSKLPSLSDEDASVLASRFHVSGGVLDNICSMVIMDEILEGRPMDLNDIISYCESYSCRDSTRIRIGFSQSPID